jgi:ATP-binding cassette subfamily C protein
MTAIKKILAILTTGEKKQFLWLGFAMFIMGLLEVIGVASILPFMQLVADPEVVEREGIIKDSIDLFGFSNRRQMIIATGVVVIFLITITNVFAVFTNWLKYVTSWKLIHNLAKRLLAGYLRRPYAFFLNTPTAQITTYVLTEVNGFANGVVIPLVEIVGRITVSLIIFGMLVWVDPVIALVMFGTLGSSYVLIYLLQRKVLKRLGEIRIEANVQRFRSLGEVFDGIKTVMVYNRQAFFYQHFSEASHKFSKLQPKYQVLVATPKNVLEILAFSTIITITIYLYLSEGNFRTVAPTLSLYAVAGYRLLPALQKAFAAIGNFRHHSPLTDKLYDSVKDADSGDNFDERTAERLPLTKTLLLEDLSFQYEAAERPAIAGINLSIARGETVAFVGSTGSGKTTLVDLMVGLLKPSGGRILVDGVPLTPENTANWRAALAYVPQDVFLFDDSVLNNILMGADAGAKTAEENIASVYEALDLADIGDFTRSLPEGIHTKIGEKGVRLSGGQRQRLGLARALFSKPSVLVLDEATSALDNVTERGIIAALRNLPRNITTIVIAHRLSTVQHADRIYFLADGKVIDQGSFKSLVGSNPAFARMAQFA